MMAAPVSSAPTSEKSRAVTFAVGAPPSPTASTSTLVPPPERFYAGADRFEVGTRWLKPTVSKPSTLCDLPEARIGVQNRYRPEVPSATPKNISRAEVVLPRLEFGATCPVALKESITTLFGQVAQVAANFGLGDTHTTTFHVHYISRKKWLDRLYDFDRDREREPPTLWARFSRWLTRIIHAWTIPIEKDATQDIFIIAENFRSQTKVSQNKCLAEVMVQCLQRASHPRFLARQSDYLKHMRTDYQSDLRPYLASKAMAEMNLQLCLDGLERNYGIKLEKAHWIADRWAFWRRKTKPELKVMMETLRQEPSVDRLFRLMFEDESYAQLLLQNGGTVELPHNLSSEEKVLADQLRQINPNPPPRALD